MLYRQDNRIVYEYASEKVWIEPWGSNGLRIRAIKQENFPAESWALSEKPVIGNVTYNVSDNDAVIVHGKIKAHINKQGKIMVYNDKGKVLLEEYTRDRIMKDDAPSLNIMGREFRPILGGDYELKARFLSQDIDEKIFGMGQYQQPYLDLKGLDIELAHRNSQASVPFALSSRGYGFLWNNPAVGRAVFGKNIMTFEAVSTKALDYWVVAGDTPAEIEESYAQVTGTVPMMPEYGLGFWQCKLRYQTQEELLTVAREYRKRNLPIDLIVIDFFHWPHQGDWRFDLDYWPDPEAMVRELKALNIELMVSIWPTVDKDSENFAEMKEKGYLVRTERGIQWTYDCLGDTVHWDPTSAASRQYVWEKAKKNYFEFGIKTFWLDEAEPEYNIYDFDNYRYAKGPNTQIGNIYPVEYARAFYEGQTAASQTNIVNLIRCAWAGSQKFGALVWSGDVGATWTSFRNQLAAGLNMGIAGIPWWTTDIGGFHGGNADDPEYRELIVRWFQWGTFCPVMRLHGCRDPEKKPLGTSGGGVCASGADNEVWSYGEEVYGIFKAHMEIREELRDYIRDIMEEAHKKGTPVMRPLFYDFSDDKKCWEIEDQYMFGPKYLCCPVLYAGQKKKDIYLPAGKWSQFKGNKVYEGGRTVTVECTLETMPVFVRE